MESEKRTSCHGQYDCLAQSGAADIGNFTKFSYHVRRLGLREAVRRTMSKAMRLAGVNTARRKSPPSTARAGIAAYEVLNLKPGELVEVKSLEEILDTLDDRRVGVGRNKGLLFMLPMPNFCGKRYMVYKRLNRILLEATGELKKVKNTVLLEGVVCDGKDFYACDRSCYHFWREVWLKRVAE
jgi:hypothetical protein